MKLFRRSDINLYYTFFQEIWDSGDVFADPSGWRDTEADAADLMPSVQLDKKKLGRYYLDEGDLLGSIKDDILGLIEFWESRPIAGQEITLYNSVSTANAAVLLALRRLGAKSIIFETPAYGVTINQARYAGYKVILVPTYLRDNFTFTAESVLQGRSGPTIIWLTQPRMSLGFDQDEKTIEEILNGLSPDDFLVIDEATEQRCPSVLSGLHGKANTQRLLRVRGLLKPLGLNGIRLSCVIHAKSLRESLENVQDVVGASLDLYSLEACAELARRKDHFFTMLSVANDQVVSLRRRAEVLALNSGIRVSHLVNGYMGTIFIPLSGGPKEYRRNKAELLRYCRDKRMPVILGSSMFFAFDAQWEQVRLNYFNRQHHVLRAVEALTAFLG
jgi:histidinol-phosphate/aromatic aminotransferase/cobyric acid decarboxylase-like protein